MLPMDLNGGDLSDKIVAGKKHTRVNIPSMVYEEGDQIAQSEHERRGSGSGSVPGSLRGSRLSINRINSNSIDKELHKEFDTSTHSDGNDNGNNNVNSNSNSAHSSRKTAMSNGNGKKQTRSGNRARILVVMSSAMQRNMLVKQLERIDKNWQINEATQSEQALVKLKAVNGKYDVIIVC